MNTLFSDINISQGSVVTRFRCDEIFNNSFIANFQEIVIVKNFLKIGQYLMKLCLKYYWFLFFRTRCIYKYLYVSVLQKLAKWSIFYRPTAKDGRTIMQ